MNEVRNIIKTDKKVELKWIINSPPPVVYSPEFTFCDSQFQLYSKSSELYLLCISSLSSIVLVHVIRIIIGHKNSLQEVKDINIDFENNYHYIASLDLLKQNTIDITIEFECSINKSPFIGLPNSSVHCYMNSMIQVIFSEPVLESIFLNWEGEISEELTNLYCEIYNKAQYFELNNEFIPNTDNLLKVLKLSSEEEDVSEFFYKLIDKIEQEITDSEKEVYEKKIEQLQILQTTTLSAVISKRESKSETNELILRVPVTGYSSLKKAFLSLNGTELLQNAFSSNSEFEDAEREYTFEFNDLIIMQPERVAFNTQTFKAEKNNSKQSYQKRLKVGQLKECYGGEYYYLSSFIVHEGVASSGHYIAYTSNAGEWYCVNDQQVKTITEREAFSFTGENGQSPYLLFYRRIYSCNAFTPNGKLQQELLSEYKSSLAEEHTDTEHTLQLINLQGQKQYVEYCESDILHKIVSFKFFLIKSNGHLKIIPNCFTNYYQLKEFEQPIEIFETASQEVQCLLYLFVPNDYESNDFIRFLCSSDANIKQEVTEEAERILTDEYKLELIRSEYNMYLQEGKDFIEISGIEDGDQVILEFRTRVPEEVSEPKLVTYYQEEIKNYYIFSVNMYEQFLESHVSIEFSPFIDSELISNLSRSSDRILNLSFGDLKENMIHNYLHVNGFDISEIKINPIPSFRFEARFSDLFDSILKYYYGQITDYSLVCLAGEQLTVKEFIDLFSKNMSIKQPDELLVYNDVEYDGRPINKSISLNFLNSKDKTLEEVLERPLNKFSNSSFIEPTQEYSIDCSLFTGFASVKTPSLESEIKEESYYEGILKFHYRVPLFSYEELFELRPYRIIVIYSSEPIFDYYIYLQRAIDAVRVYDFEQKIEEELYDFMNCLFSSTSVKYELIFSTQTTDGHINQVLDEEFRNIAEFRGYPMNQKLIFRVDIVKEGSYKFIDRYDDNNDTFGFPFCVNNNLSIEKELQDEEQQYITHLSQLSNINYVKLFYHSFRQRVYTKNYFTSYEIVSSQEEINGIRCGGEKVIEDLDLFKGEELFCQE